MSERDGFHSTCWMVIEQASAGSGEARDDFASRYLEVVRAYLANRWKGCALLAELDDAVQEVFLECFRQGGVLDRMHDRKPDSFRAFLYGVARNVARRCEKRVGAQRERRPVIDVDPERVAAGEATQSRVFDRAWATSLFRQAGERQRTLAQTSGEGALRRVELLELRSQEDLPIRAIAARWGRDAAIVHKEYARARREFKTALFDVLTFHHPGLSRADLDEKCRELTALLEG